MIQLTWMVIYVLSLPEYHPCRAAALAELLDAMAKLHRRMMRARKLGKSGLDWSDA